MGITITVSYAKTFNLGNYESEKINAEIIEDLKDDDERSYQQAFYDLYEECQTFVAKRHEENNGKVQKRTNGDGPF